MANSLLIEKYNGGYFRFTLNNEQPINNYRNDLFSVGDNLHFKTSNGANIIKQQDITPQNLTVIADNTNYFFTSVDNVFQILTDIGYFDWFKNTGGGGSGSGVDRFIDLLDTFPSYIGRDMQCVVVDESQLKLKTVPFYNKQFITEMNDFEGVLQPNKILTTNASGTKFILENKPTPPQQFLNSVGTLDYNDLNTATNPIPFLANIPIELTNDSSGANTHLTNNPYGVSSVWNSTTNSFDFSQLSIGDVVFIRTDINPTTSTANQSFKNYFVIGQGSTKEYNIICDKETRKNSGNDLSHTFTTFIDIRSDEIRLNPTKVMFVSDGAGSIIVNGWNVFILRKNINIVNVESNIPEASTTVKGIVRLGGDLAGTSQNPTVPALGTKEPIIQNSSTNNVLVGNKTWVNLENWVKGFLNNTWFGTFLNGFTTKTTPNVNDTVAIGDSQDGFKIKKISFLNLFKTINSQSIIGNGDITIAGGGGSNPTDLNYIPSPIAGAVTSSTGTQAVIPLANNTNAGLLKPSKYTVLENTIGTNSGDEVNASNSISGTVKTDITETDPVVYTKTTVDDLLGNKADLVAGFVPLNQLSSQVAIKNTEGSLLNQVSGIVEVSVLGQHLGSGYGVGGTSIDGVGGVFYSENFQGLSVNSLNNTSAVFIIENQTANIVEFVSATQQDGFAAITNKGGIIARGLIDATNLVAYDRQVVSDIDGNFGFAPKVGALKKYENTTIPTFNITTDETNFIVSVLQIPSGFILSNELYEYIGLVGIINGSQPSIDINVYSNSTNTLDGNEILLRTNTISQGYGNDITTGGVELKTLGHILFNDKNDKILNEYIIIAVTTQGFFEPVEINVPYHGIRKLN